MSRIIEAAKRILPAEQVKSWDEFKIAAAGNGATRIKYKIAINVTGGEIVSFRSAVLTPDHGRKLKIRGNYIIPVDPDRDLHDQTEEARKRLYCTVGQERKELNDIGLTPVPRIAGKIGTSITTLMEIDQCATDPKIERLTLNNGDIFKAPQK